MIASLLLSACSNTVIPVQTTIVPSDEPLTTSITTSVATVTGTPEPTGGDAVQVASEALAARLVIRPADLPSPWAGMEVRLLADGDELSKGGLDNCGYTFRTQRYRLARRQVGVLDAISQDAGVSNEVIVYDSSAHASAAFREWQNSVSGCRRGTVVRSPAPGSPRIRLDVESTATDPTLPVAQNTVTMTSSTVLSASRSRLYGITLLQVHETVLDVVQVRSTVPLTRSKINAATALAATAGRRLASG